MKKPRTIFDLRGESSEEDEDPMSGILGMTGTSR